MRILILYAGFLTRVGGTSERVFQVAKGLADQGVRVILSGDVNCNMEKQGLGSLHIVAMPNTILKFPSVIAWIMQLFSNGLIFKYDVIQVESFSFLRTLMLFLLMRPFGRRFLIVFHDKWFKEDPRKSITGKIQLFIQRILLNVFDAAITPGLSVKKWFEELHGKSLLKKMVVIPNGAPDLEIKSSADYLHLRKKYRLEPNAFLALYFGSMLFKPNYETALLLYKISNYVSNKFEKINGKRLAFIVAGMGSETLPKSRCFIPLGFVKDLEELLSLPDVIVLPHTPSYSGPHVKTIYAFLSKKPVLATEDAVKDMPFVVPGKHFLLFDVNEPDTLVDALTNIYSNVELKRNLTFNAYLYSKKFSWKYISLLHLKLYYKILKSYNHTFSRQVFGSRIVTIMRKIL
ncbi:MAG: glycosyltransferase family 4 protein [Candidatus Jordarchaeaceae archaeon]